MNKTITEYEMRIPKSNDDLWIKNVEPVPDPKEIRFVFPDGTFATFKDAGSLQEFLDKLARFHELEKDLEIARDALTGIFFICEQDASKDANARISEIYAIAKKVLEHKE